MSKMELENRKKYMELQGVCSKKTTKQVVLAFIWSVIAGISMGQIASHSYKAGGYQACKDICDEALKKDDEES